MNALSKKVRVIRVISLMLSLALFFGGVPYPLAQAEASPQPTMLYVSTDGEDVTGTGSIEQPFRTLTRARTEVRALIAGGMSADVIVNLREGVYRLEETFLLTDEDSGRDGFQVIYRSYPGEQAILDASLVIDEWELYEGGVFRSEVGPGWSFDALYENNERAVKARHPNKQGDMNMYNRVATRIEGSDTKLFGFAEGDIPAIADLSGLEVYLWPGGPQGYQYWSSYTVGVQTLDPLTRIVELQSTVPYIIGAGSRYFVQGAKELLDDPGEFFLDKAAGMLYYYPFDASNLDAGVTAPISGDVVRIKGASPEAPATHIMLESLIIRNSNLGGDGIHVENADHIAIRNNRIYNTGEHGIQLANWAKYNLVEGNEVHDAGYNGISLEGSNRTIVHMNTSNEIINNHVYRIGLYYGNAGGIRIYDSGENRVAYNRVHDVTRHAIHIRGQRKGYLVGTTIEGVPVTESNYRDYQHARNNVIEFNDVSHAMTDSQDAAVLATWGTGTGNIIRNNAIHDSEIRRFTQSVGQSFGFGLYLDDNSDEVLVENNLIYHLQHIGDGRLNHSMMLKGIGIRAQNNIVANNNDYLGAVGQTQTGNEISTELELSRNIFYDVKSNLYHLTQWDENRITDSDHNLFHHATGQYTFGGNIPVADYEEWLEVFQGKYDQHSLTEDPKFMDAANRDYRLRYDSPAYRLGFQDIDIENIGLTSDYLYADPLDPLRAIFVREANDEVNRSWVSLGIGQNAQLAVSGRTEVGFVADLSEATVSYTSSDNDIAVVDSDGLITAVAEGVAAITVTVSKNGVSRSSQFHVLVDDTLATIEVNAPQKLYLGESVAAEVYGVTNHGGYDGLQGINLAYSTDTPAIATVDANGIVTGHMTGEFELTATANVGGQQLASSVTMRVYEFDPLEGEFAGWTAGQGNWQVMLEDDNIVYKSLTGVNSARSYLNTQPMTDYTLSALVKVDEWTGLNNSRVGLIGRYVSQNTFYYAFYEHSSRSFRIMKVVNGAVTTLALSLTMNVDFETGFQLLSLTLDGEQLTLRLDGETVVQASDSDIAEGYAGLYTFNQPATYDNMIVLDSVFGGVPEDWRLTHYGDKAAYAAEEDGTYRLRASGTNVWGNSDELGFLYQSVELPPGGKVTITARLHSFDELNNTTMAGLMMRSRDTADAANAFTRIISLGNNQMTFRSEDGGSTAYFSIPDIGVPIELRLIREGSQFTSYYRTDGEWIKLAERTVSMSDQFMTGLAASAHDAKRYTEAVFSDVSIIVEEATVDRALLEAAIVEASSLDSGQYTTASWSALQAALLAAIEVHEAAEARQQEVNAAQAALQSALDALVLKQLLASAMLTGSGEVLLPGDPLTLTVGMEGTSTGFTALDVVVQYDPQKLQFDLIGEAGQQALAESAFVSLRPGLSLLGSAVKPELDQIRLILASTGQPTEGDGPLFKLETAVKPEAAAGGTAVSLTDMEISLGGSGVQLDTASSMWEFEIITADKAGLQTAILHAQSVHNAAVEGSLPGQYPYGSKQALYGVIESAIAVNEDAEATQAQVNDAIHSLNDAVRVFRNSINSSSPVDREALNTAIAAAESRLNRAIEGDKLGEYLPGSKSALAAAITLARSAGGSQYEVNQALNSLNQALSLFSSKLVTLIEGETRISIKDLSILAQYYGITADDAQWNAIEKADVLRVNVIDLRNLAAVAQMILDEWRLQ